MTIDFRARFRENRPYTSDRDKTARPAPNPASQLPRLSQFESDRGRIINSAAIRRLQQKTQVFPLERNSSVRSRLTHSLEVQQVGRHIVQRIYHQLGTDARQYGLQDLERHFESVVEMGCLMHDVGNPPFGHFGEQAMNDWFRGYQGLNDLPEPLYKDLTEFEGNAQAVRLVYSILSLNLTYTQVSAILKYTRRGDENRPARTHSGHSAADAGQPYLKKKVGYYLSEDDFIGHLYQTLGLEKGSRSPFAYIMEAADDISYGIADIEDAVEKGIINREQTSEALCQEYLHLLEDERYASADPEKMAQIVSEAQSRANDAQNCAVSHFFITLRVEISQLLPRHAATQFIDHIEAIYHGRFHRPLIENFSTEHALVEALKNVAKKHAFCDRDVEARELQGYQIITGLLNYFKPLLALDRQAFLQVKEGDRRPLLASRLFSKLPGKHLRAYDNAMKEIEAGHYPGGYNYSPDTWEYYFRVRLIQDYISGMTDQYAFDEYRAFSVIDSL